MATTLWRHSPRICGGLLSAPRHLFVCGSEVRHLASGLVRPGRSEVVTRAREDKTMSSAMKMYLMRKREHDNFMEKERDEFEMGRQHLANMMGRDDASFTQEDIDSSIEYLFPSGLAPEARPVMKPPEEIFHRQKDAEFDVAGRPYHPFFYTLKPNLSEAMYQLRDHMVAVTIFGDRLRSQRKKPDPEQVLTAGKLATSRWVNRDELAAMVLEEVGDAEYKDMVDLLERLLELPYSYRVKDELWKWRVDIQEMVGQTEYFTPQFDDQGRAFVECPAQRKSTFAQVRVTKPGTGMLTIRHEEFPQFSQDISYFFSLKERHQLLYPLQFTKMLGLVDIDATVRDGGPTGQAGAIRYGIAMCLRTFVDKKMADDMKLCGLLTQDIRVRERKKYGKSGARKNYTWKRR